MVAGALVVTAVGAGVTFSVRRADALPDRGMTQPDPHELDDGFEHYVVSVDGSDEARLTVAADPSAAVAAILEEAASTAATTTPTAAPSPTTTAPAASSNRIEVPLVEADGKATAASLAAASSQGTIIEVHHRADGVLVAVVEPTAPAASAPPSTTAPTSAPATTPTTAPTPAPTPTPNDALAHTSDAAASPATGDAIAAQLAAVPGTQHVAAISAGAYAVTTSAEPVAYATVPGVASIADDAIAFASTDDTYWGYQWSLENTGSTVDGGYPGVVGADIGVLEAWPVSTGRGQTIAVVDTGMDITHPDLVGSLWKNTREVCGNGADDDGNGYADDCDGWDIVNNDKTLYDTGSGITNDHATHIAGMYAATKDNARGIAGIAPDAKVMPVKVANGSSMWMSDVARGIRYAVDNGATIVNLSLGTSPGAAQRSQVADVEAAIQYGQSRGVLMAVAAGNDHANIDTQAVYPASLPQDNILTVGASNSRDVSASFSNYGPIGVDVFAPGSTIASTLPGGGYGTMSGTSMAAPEAGAMAALYWSVHPAAGYAAVKAALMTSTAGGDAFVGKAASGHRVDIGELLNPAGDGVSFAFAGLAGGTDGSALHATVGPALASSAVPPGTRVGYRATLLTTSGGHTYGVIGAAVTTDAGVTATDDDASVVLGDAAGYATADAPNLAVAMALPAGDYALVADATRTDDGVPVGRPWVSYFSVAGAGGTNPPGNGGNGGGGGSTPTTTIPPSSGPGAPTTTTPRGSTTTTAPRTTPTTTRPGATPTTTPSSPTPTPTTAVPPGPTTTAPRQGTPPVTSPGATPPTTTPGSPTPTTTPITTPVTSPTTRPPTTVAPSPTTTRAPTTTAPPSTTPPSTTPALPPPGTPIDDGTLAITLVNPRYGSTQGGDRIEIQGRGFHGSMYVLFGSIPGVSVSVVSSTSLLVTTPAHIAGTVDLRVSVQGGSSLVFAAAYTYRAPGPSGTVPAPGSPVPTTTPAPGTPSPTTTPTTSPAPSPTTTPPGPTTTAPDDGTPATRPARFTFGTEQTVNGLRVREVTTGPGIDAGANWASRACQTASCPAQRT